MDWKKCIILFLMNISDDALAALYVRRCAAGEALQAGVISGILTVVIAYSVIHYVRNWRYLLPIALGSALGSYLAIALDVLR